MSDKWLSDVTLYGTAAEVREGVEAVVRRRRPHADPRAIERQRRPDEGVRGDVRGVRRLGPYPRPVSARTKSCDLPVGATHDDLVAIGRKPGFEHRAGVRRTVSVDCLRRSCRRRNAPPSARIDTGASSRETGSAACQFEAHVALDDPVRRQAPRRVQPDDRISGFEKRQRPVEVHAFAHPLGEARPDPKWPRPRRDARRPHRSPAAVRRGRASALSRKLNEALRQPRLPAAGPARHVNAIGFRHHEAQSRISPRISHAGKEEGP